MLNIVCILQRQLEEVLYTFRTVQLKLNFIYTASNLNRSYLMTLSVQSRSTMSTAINMNPGNDDENTPNSWIKVVFCKFRIEMKQN